MSAGLAIYDLGVAANKKDGWGVFRASCDLVMTGVGIYFPVAGLIYFGATFTYDLYQLSKEP